MKLNPRKITAVLLLLGGIGLLQYHAIMFWTDVVDPLTGWAWSILLEGAALWCWSHHNAAIRWVLGAIATLLVLTGPLYHVAAPLVAEGLGMEQNAVQRQILTAEIASLEQDKETFLANSEKRVGWASRIDSVQAKLDSARAELRNLTASEPQRLEWQRQAIILMQAIALVLFQLLNVVMIRTLSANADKVRNKLKVGKPSRPMLAIVNAARAAIA